MNYRETWDLSTIPDDKLNAEFSRRRASKREYAAKCSCGKCKTCLARERMRLYRKKTHPMNTGQGKQNGLRVTP